MKLILIISTLIVGSFANVGKYLCEKNGDIKISSIEVTDFVPDRAQGVNLPAACASGLITGTGIIVISGNGKSGSGYSVALTTTQCGASTAGTVTTYKIIVAAKPKIIAKTDLLFTFTCDTAKPSTKEITATLTTVSGDPKAGTANLDIPVTLAVLDNKDSPVTSSALGADITLAATLTTTGAAKACLINSCVASSSNTFSDNLDLFSATGCSVVSGVFTDKSKKFSKTAGTNKITYKSDTFKTFRMATGQAVYFRCTCTPCTKDTDAACATPACTAKKRRSVRDVSRRNETTISSVILVLDKVAPKLAGNVNAGQQDVSFTNCLNHVSFISVVAILALLLMISLGVSVFFCSKLIRQREQPKDCYPNPAYKA